jgi:hypothetical protein
LAEIVRNGYLLAVGSWGIQPGEFWRMTPREWAWLLEFKQGPVTDEKMPGTLTRTEAEELATELAADLKAEGVRNGRRRT